ncbi:MAG: hypothetical protein Q7U03_00635 [Syntrophales bacterium]|nr:hypothetical protein [Syntrophales bacterium]
MMDMEIEALIPHRDRMRLIGEIMAVDDDRAVTLSAVTEEWPLYRDGSVDALVTIELVAQTAALMEGWTRLKSGRGGTSGWLVGIKTADFRLLHLCRSKPTVTNPIRQKSRFSRADLSRHRRLGS